MADLVVETRDGRYRLPPGPCYYLVGDGTSLHVTTDEHAQPRLGFFAAGMKEQWYFRTDSVTAVRHLRLGVDAVSRGTTAVTRPHMRLRWTEPAQGVASPGRRSSDEGWLTPANILALAGLVLAILTTAIGLMFG